MDNPTENIDPLADLAFLDRFNSLFSQKAEARASYPLENREEGLLKSLASGEIKETDRSSAIALLAANTEAMEFFTKLLKEDR